MSVAANGCGSVRSSGDEVQEVRSRSGGPGRFFARSSTWVTLVLALSLTACSGKKILEDQSHVREQSLSVVKPSAGTLQITRGGIPAGKKYHVGIRVSEQFLNRAATKLLEAEVVPSRFENPVSIKLPPFGTQVTLKPGITVENPRLAFTGACPECLKISSHFVGRLSLDLSLSASSASTRLFDSAALSGDITLNARIIPMYTGGIPSLGIQLDPVPANDLRISTSVPVMGLDSLITSAVHSQIISAMSISRNNTFSLLPIRALGVPGSKLTVDEIGYFLLTRPEGELFVGLTLNLTTAPEIDLETRGRQLRSSDFAVLVGQNTLTDALRVWMAEGLVPAAYDTAGNPNPKGPVMIEFKRLELFEDHYESFARMWHIGQPPFWREFKLTGGLGVRSEAVTLRIDKAEEVERAGPNTLIDLALKMYRVSLTGALAGVGSRVPRQVGFPFGSPAKLTANVNVEEVQTDRKRMTVYGDVVFVQPGIVTPAAGVAPH